MDGLCLWTALLHRTVVCRFWSYCAGVVYGTPLTDLVSSDLSKTYTFWKAPKPGIGSIHLLMLHTALAGRFWKGHKVITGSNGPNDRPEANAQLTGDLGQAEPLVPKL